MSIKVIKGGTIKKKILIKENNTISGIIDIKLILRKKGTLST
jgi:hypothetical protein